MKRSLAIVLLIAAAACAPVGNKPEGQLPQVGEVTLKASARKVEMTASCSQPAAVKDCGFELCSLSGSNTYHAQCDPEGRFQTTVDGLNPDTDYRVRAFLSNDRNVIYSEWNTFHTSSLPAFSLRADASVFTATIYADFIGESPRQGILFGPNSTDMTAYPDSGGKLLLSNLKPETTYYYAAYAEQDGVEERSDIQSFRTGACFESVTGRLDTDGFSVQLSALPMFGNEIVPDAFGFYLGIEGRVVQSIEAQVEDRSWTASAGHLSPCQHYWYCAYVTVAGKEYLSAKKQFETGVMPFEDPAFWEYLLGNYDTDRDGQLNISEMDAITFLPMFNLGIKSLSGIENLHNLNQIQMSEEALTRIDFSAIADNKIEALVLYAPNLEEFILPSMQHPETRYGGHFEFTSNSLRGHWEFPDYAALQVIINAPVSSINLDRVTNNQGHISLDLHGTEIEELDLSNLAVSLSYANLTGNEKLKVIWLPYGSGNSSTIVKDSWTQIKYK